ncbi:MAG: glycosyltransferase family 39 protein, partial [Myxococcales bacterium]|nr:glycosyltransferase family 39 protein [Myxococcales bacterium]
VAKLGIHLALATRYGRHRDEYYFIDCGQNLAFGYVDHAPLVPWLAGLSTALFGDSLLMLRFPSILAGAGTVWLAILLSRRFGANVYGQALAGLAVLFAPAYLRMHGMLDLPAFEPLFWTVAALLLADLIDGADRRRWLLIGAVVGLGLMNKHTMLLWGLGVGVGVLATPLRAHLRTRWPWLGAAIAFGIFTPNLVWQAQHGWPTLQFIQNMREMTLAEVPRHLFAAGQILYMGPLALPIWLCGLVYFFTDAGKRYRLFGWLFVTVLFALTVMHAKPYYSAPAYPMVFAAGGAWLGRWFESRHVLRNAFIAALIVSGLALGAITLPVFPLSKVDATLERALGWVVRPVDLTHDMHDEFGWAEQAAAVETVFAGLSPHERQTATIFTANYGQASALNLHGPAHGLPRATSGHMNHHLWGPDPSRPGPLIVVGLSSEDLAMLCEGPHEAGRIMNPDAMESNIPIYVCRDHVPLGTLWPKLARYHHGRAGYDAQ